MRVLAFRKRLKNSIVRKEKPEAFAQKKDRLTEAEIRNFMLKRYPEGMTANYYKEGFGTIKTVVWDTAEKRYSICWLGRESNGWTDYRISEKPGGCVEEKEVEILGADPQFFALRSIL